MLHFYTNNNGDTYALRYSKKSIYLKKLIFLTSLLLFGLFFSHPVWAAIGGSGTSSSPYTINSVDDWITFRNYIDNDQNNYGKHWKLTTNINIGTNAMVGNSSCEFEGVFDGDGHTITISSTTAWANENYVGLFQATYGGPTNTVTIKNLNVTMGYLDGKDYSGALIGEARASLILENVHVTQSGTTDRYGWQSGGFIGKFWRNSGHGNCNISITNCSYINTGTLKFNSNASTLDAGGFVGYIESGYSSITFTDCMVYLASVSFNGNSGPFGGFIGATHSNVTMIRCVQTGTMNSNMNASYNRAFLVGWIENGKTITCRSAYVAGDPKKGTAGSSTGTISGSCSSVDSWGDYDYEYKRLERYDNYGNSKSSSTRGNERWGVATTTYPRLTSTNYAIQLTKGTNIGNISGNGYSTGSYSYRAANTQLTVTPSSTPTAHQRIKYTFTPAYNHSGYNASSNPNYTASMSGNNYLLASKTNGTVSAVFENIPYPYYTNMATNEINTELLPFENKIRVTWKYDNPQNLTGKFYVYCRDNNNEPGVYEMLTPSGLTLENGNGKTKTYDITSDYFQFNKSYQIVVGYVEGTAPENPDQQRITSANKAANNDFNTAVDIGNWNVEAIGGEDKIAVKLSGIDNRFTNSTSWSYKIQRSINGSPYEDWLTNQSFSGKTEYTHDNTGIVTSCDAYRYKAIISAFGTTYEKETGEAHSTGSTKFLTTETPFKATKGEHADYVRLQWKVNRSGSGTGDTYTVYRKTANTAEEWSEMETVTSNAGTVYWNDNNALTGVFYNYKVVLFQNCSNTLSILDSKEDIGFTQAFGTVSGRVTYGTSGSAVKDVNMLARRNQLRQGEAQYHSMKATGGGQKFEWLANDPDYFNNIWTSQNWTLQFWVNPDGSNTGNNIIGYIGGNVITMSAVTGGYQIYIDFFSSFKSEIIPANKFSHVAITRTGNNMRIYTLCDANPDSIYIKNTQFVHSTATAQTAANCKISFGHALKGNVDDVRFWNRALSEVEILRDYSRMLVGDEDGLRGYWTFDENLENHAFDRSRSGTVYNNNHATTNTLTSSTVVPDDTYQLALKAITDANGNYQISGIAYHGEGTSYSIVPSLGVHLFNPTEQLRYVAPSSIVHNSTDFTDISSFMLRGKVVYEGGNYPVVDCSFEVDGKTLTLPDGSVVKSDNTGEFEISVPIGQHSVRVAKQGHTFANSGYLKDENGIDYFYNAPKANIVFNDQTKVKLIGRVVGGNAEDGKPLAFGESVNNIGVDSIVLSSTLQMYNFSTSPVSATYNHNNGQWNKPNASLADDQTTVDYNQKNVTIHVSPVTGEFSAMIYPEPYDIQPISVTQGKGQPVLVIKENAENIDLSTAAVPDESYMQTEVRTWKDSAYIANRPGVVDHWEYSEKSDTVRYNSKWTYKYQATPTFGVKQVVNDTEVDYFGEKNFELKDELAGTTETLNLYDETTQTYLFEKPVFQQGNEYNLRFNAYEQYTNYVSDPAATVIYPISNGTVDITNNLQVTAQPENASMDSLGILNYRFTAGAPNLTTASSDIFATLALGAVSYYWDMGTTPLEAWQLGEKTTGTNFMTSGPDQLTAILRDPPGTASFAYIEQGTTISSTSTITVGVTTSENLNLTTSLGPKVTAFVGLGAGVITESEVKLDVSSGLSSEQSYSNENEEITTTTFTERFETSSSSDYVGAMGDVFIGNSTNILYGLTNGVKIQKGETAGTTFSTQGDYKIASSAAIAYGQEFDTRFAFTAYELENMMIPKWQNSIANRLLPAGTEVNTAIILSPVYVSKLQPADVNYGKWNLDETFKNDADFDIMNPYDGVSYKIYFPASWTPTSEPMKNFQDSILWANNQINTWEAVLAQNEKEKVEMTHKGNYSFGGGANIEYSESTAASTSYTHNFGFNLTPSLGAVVGGDVMGIGMELETSVSVAAESGGSSGGSVETSLTTGFMLSEEGNSDEITVDYGYTAGGTFAFKTRGGQTSCPYEGGEVTKYYQPGQHILQEATMRVEVPVINVSSASQVLNVPANRTANFTLALQNESEVGEDMWFQLIIDEATNPNGAELKIDGIGIGNGRTFLAKAGETLTKTLTVTKGTVDDYDNIGLILRSMCQADPTGTWEVIADTTWITAHFVPACSEVSIAQPADNFIVNTESENGSTLSVTLQNFDVNFPNFGYIRLEYRATGTPIWSTARTFYPTNLFNSPTNTEGTKEDIGNRAAIVYDWSMPPADGQYELRATTASVNIVDDAIVGNPLSTYSTAAITGYKDMVKPQVLGTPSPINGIYGDGDELSVTFNEDINTSMIISDNITVTYGNDIPVPITFVSSSNKITMEYPADYFAMLEGQTLKIEVKDIYDMRGNKSEPIIWTAFVNRNALIWETAEVNLTKAAGETLTFNATIKNAGSSIITYLFATLPQWLSVNLPTGNLQPLQSKELTFTISNGVNLGTYSEQIGVTSGNGITKNLPLNLRVTGVYPENWTVDPAGYENTMAVTGCIQVEGIFQYDEADVLAAFIDNKCVGITSPIKPLETSNEYYTFLTIYGNAIHAGQPIKFKVWDASTGNIYSVVESRLNNVLQNLTFAANTIKGSASVPVIHNALNMIEQGISLNNGWNWVSVNVLNSNPSILQQFKDNIGSAGEMLKGQNGYIQPPSWAGTLSNIEKEQMYLVKTNTTTTLYFDGAPADAAISPITLVNGWNWIGYIPQFMLPVNEALKNLTAQTDDQIKGQMSYRIYAGEDIGWVGTLNYMRSGEGYMYNSGATTDKTFNYPSTSSQVYQVWMQNKTTEVENHWTTDIYKYSNTMTMTSVVIENDVELQSDLIEIAAFDDSGECRGSVMQQNVPQVTSHPYIGFLMVFGEQGDNLTLKVYDHATDSEYTAFNIVSFVTDAINGTPEEPYKIWLTPSGIDGIGIEQQVTIYPNPAVEWLTIESRLPVKEIRIIDALGRIMIVDDSLNSNTINISSLTSGLYTIQITTKESVVTRKFVKK